MSEGLAALVPVVEKPLPEDIPVAIPDQAELWSKDDVLKENAADVNTVRRLKAALTLRQLLNQLEAFREARSTIHELLAAAATDEDESLELPRLMARHAVEDPKHAADMHDLMDMAEVKAIEDLDRELAHGHGARKEAPMEVLQARFYASYRERTGADNFAPGETI